MKYINLIMGILLLASCSPEDVTVKDFSVTGADIKALILRADHKTLLPNGVAKMEFHVLAFGEKELTKYTDVQKADTMYYNEESVKVLYEIPSDLLPKDYIKVYDENGTELKDNIFSTTEPGVREIRFYAQAGDVRSDDYEITIRELPDENYDEIVYPVIFHVLIPPPSSGPTYSISSEFLQEKLDRINDIFNRKVTTDPNGGNAKISFRLAEYDEDGMPLVEKGKHEVQMSSALSSKDSYVEYIESRLIWDPRQYLNIWIAKFSNSISDSGSETYYALDPSFMLSGNEDIPGFNIEVVDNYTVWDIVNFRDAGFMVNYHEFLNPNAMGSNSFELGTALAAYFGLRRTDYYDNSDIYWQVIETGDTDYCPDTYFYSKWNQLIYKNNDLSECSYDLDVDPIEYFTSFNVMDRYSRKNSLSVDQVKRIRSVIKACPSRWAYKSTWAFTGEE